MTIHKGTLKTLSIEHKSNTLFSFVVSLQETCAFLPRKNEEINSNNKHISSQKTHNIFNSFN